VSFYKMSFQIANFNSTLATRIESQYAHAT